MEISVHSLHVGGDRSRLASPIRAAEHARQTGHRTGTGGSVFTHLLHLDDDELLYVPGGVEVLHACAQSASAANNDVIELHALTLEALSPSIECSNPFVECCAFRHSADDYSSYGGGDRSHGKSIGLLATRRLAPYNPHHFCAGGDMAQAAGNPFQMRAVAGAEHDATRTFVLPPPVAVIQRLIQRLITSKTVRTPCLRACQPVAHVHRTHPALCRTNGLHYLACNCRTKGLAVFPAVHSAPVCL